MAKERTANHQDFTTAGHTALHSQALRPGIICARASAQGVDNPPVSAPIPPRPTAPTAERWSTQAGDAATATLTIPADARRVRRFEIACAVVVDVPAPATAGATAPWLQVTVQANGTQQWQRRTEAHNPGAWDGLDYRFSRSVPVAQTLRVTVTVAGQGVRRRSLVIEADEI